MRTINGGEMMSAIQEDWASRLREIPITFRKALLLHDDRAIRHRPAAGEWSAIEVLGHMIDKMQNWSRRTERILTEERPALSGYDQDASVRDHRYQHADAEALLEQLSQSCEHFAAIVERIPEAALERKGVHGELGPITLRYCVEIPIQSAEEHLEQLRAAQMSG
jgi:DinB superfamily